MKRRKAIVVLGSPRRKGNSATLAGRVAAGLKAAGADVETVYLHGMDLRPCSACDGCRRNNWAGCVIDDDMKDLFPRLRHADIWVLASPIYFFTVSGQMKLFMDRWYSLRGPKGYDFEGKRMGVVLTYEDVDVYASGGVNALRTLEDAFRYVKADYVGAVYGTAHKAGEIRHNRQLMKQAYQLGVELVKGS